MEWTYFIEKGKVSSRFLLPIAVITGCLLFFPDSWKEKLALTELGKQYSIYIGPVFFLSTTLIFLEVIVNLFNWLKRQINYGSYKSLLKQNIKELGPFEKAVVREFYLLKQDTLPFPFQNSIVAGLLNKGIIEQAGQYGEVRYGTPLFNYSLTIAAKKIITLDKIDYPVGVNEENKRFLFNNRPSWN